MFFPMYFDSTYILIIIGFVICLIATGNVKSTYAKYSKIRSRRNITAYEACENILKGAGIYDVKIERISGDLTDNYDPRTKVLHLSDSTYNSTSVAAIGVAAHECGHAIQHATDYAPLNLRKALVPVVNFGSYMAFPILLIGFIFNSRMSHTLINIGILLFSLTVVFALITLPVEFNASNRAIKILSNSNMLDDEEVSSVSKVLRAAAMTYVASAISAILSLLRIILLSNRRD